MHASTLTTIVLGLGQSALAQDLPSALQKYSDVSTFQGLISRVPGGVSSLLPSGLKPNSTTGVTVLVPSNKAFSTFLNATNTTNITAVPPQQLLDILSYHIMYAKLTSNNFSAPNGLVVPTLLKDEKYNNRSAGAELVNTYGADAAQGNVLYVSRDPINPVKFKVRRAKHDGSDDGSDHDSHGDDGDDNRSGVALRGGMGQGATISAVNGVWDLGYFQLIDAVLFPPAPCSTTVRGQSKLKTLDAAITTVGLWDALDHSANVTCLAPTNAAFSAAGIDPNLGGGGNASELESALLFHTLPMPLYSPYLVNGVPLKVKSMGGQDVTVLRLGGDVYFNDAKVVSPNVLTNNGVLHVLDRVMSPNTAPNATAPTSTTTSVTTGTATSTGGGGVRTSTTGVPGAGSSTGTASPNAANPRAVVGGGGNAVGGLLAFFGAAALLF